MFYYIKGKLITLGTDFAAIDCGGVCYKLMVSAVSQGALAPKIGSEVLLYTYLNVREDAMELFGFSTEQENDCFKLLITVSGVGPKAAMAILSALSPERLTSAIVNGDARAVSSAQGVGLKTAQKIILELKDKFGKLGFESTAESVIETGSVGGGNLAAAKDTLVVMGYTKAEAEAALKTVDRSLSLEEMIREGLKKLVKF